MDDNPKHVDYAIASAVSTQLIGFQWVREAVLASPCLPYCVLRDAEDTCARLASAELVDGSPDEARMWARASVELGRMAGLSHRYPLPAPSQREGE